MLTSSFLTKTTLVAFAFGSVAVAGDIRLGSRLISGVRLVNDGVTVGCEQVLCLGDNAVRSFRPLYNTGSAAIAPSFEPSANPYKIYSGALPAEATANPSSVIFTGTSNSQGADNSSPTFAMVNGRILELTSNGWIDRATGEAVTGQGLGPKVVAYGDNQFPDPIVTATFNNNSTTIATRGLSAPSTATPGITIVTPEGTASTSGSTPLSIAQSISSPILTTDLNSPSTGSTSGHGSTTGIVRSTGNTDPVSDPTGTIDDSLIPGSGSGPLPADAPEPASVMLFGAGLLVTGIFKALRCC